MGKLWVVALCLTVVTEVDARDVHVLSTVSSPYQDYITYSRWEDLCIANAVMSCYVSRGNRACNLCCCVKKCDVGISVHGVLISVFVLRNFIARLNIPGVMDVEWLCGENSC